MRLAVSRDVYSAFFKLAERRDTVWCVWWGGMMACPSDDHPMMHLSTGVNQLARNFGAATRNHWKDSNLPKRRTRRRLNTCLFWLGVMHTFNLIFKQVSKKHVSRFELFTAWTFSMLWNSNFHCAGFYFGWRLGDESDKRPRLVWICFDWVIKFTKYQ